MSAIVKSISDLIGSLFEVVGSLFTTAGDLILQTFHFAFKFFSGTVNLIIDFFKGLVDLAGGIAGFILGKRFVSIARNCSVADPCTEFDSDDSCTGNIAILAVLAVASVAFLQFQRKQGNTVKVGNKKLN